MAYELFLNKTVTKKKKNSEFCLQEEMLGGWEGKALSRLLEPL